jgi:hypothetical protein
VQPCFVCNASQSTASAASWGWVLSSTPSLTTCTRLCVCGSCCAVVWCAVRCSLCGRHACVFAPSYYRAQYQSKDVAPHTSAADWRLASSTRPACGWRAASCIPSVHDYLHAPHRDNTYCNATCHVVSVRNLYIMLMRCQLTKRCVVASACWWQSHAVLSR